MYGKSPDMCPMYGVPYDMSRQVRTINFPVRFRRLFFFLVFLSRLEAPAISDVSTVENCTLFFDFFDLLLLPFSELKESFSKFVYRFLPIGAFSKSPVLSSAFSSTCSYETVNWSALFALEFLPSRRNRLNCFFFFGGDSTLFKLSSEP